MTKNYTITTTQKIVYAKALTKIVQPRILQLQY